MAVTDTSSPEIRAGREHVRPTDRGPSDRLSPSEGHRQPDGGHLSEGTRHPDDSRPADQVRRPARRPEGLRPSQRGRQPDRSRPSERSPLSVRLRPGPSRRDRGQTAIEFVGVTPFIILLLVALWQCALIGYTFSLAGNAADVGARAGTGAEWGRSEACAQAATEDLPGAWSSAADVSCSTEPGLYRAEVRLKVPVLVPGVLDFPMTVTGDAAAVKEG
ncbi:MULTISPECIES: TadE family protein [Streptomyces]|uniref:TadE-like domain-containing protein n=1 Tax=Streptomyces clavifer TaxID=68188 RepID=A0ABS4V6R7_9ACTN|nr:MULTISPECIES: TadE family protein [Streptomyces]MBP2359379.1 hypothetical protein [Streptomyces clavifer]GHA80802.1 hypothetical protein GCM10010392_03240 [Streptomyces clavifer]